MLPFGETEFLTLVLEEERKQGNDRHGFLQAKRYPAWDLMYIQSVMPSLDGDEDASTIWNRLLNHAVAAAAERGVHRVFCCAGEGSSEMAVLAGVGFSQYAREDIYQLAPDAHPQAEAPERIRPEQSTDQWAIAQLYRQVTPRLVQQAESPADSAPYNWQCGPLGWGQGEGFVLEDQQGIAGYGYLRSGRAGHWLNVLVHSRAYDQAGDLLDYGLALLNYYPPHPVYCGVRAYQGGMRTKLADRGFTLFARQCYLVRHTLVRVKEAARGLVPALEQRVEAPTTTVSPTEQHRAR
jgi:hypothetical protein